MTMAEIQEMNNKMHVLAERRANEWFVKQVHNPYGAYYLYNRIGDFTISEDKPDNRYEISHGQRISPAWTVQIAKSFILDNVGKLSILPLE